MQLNLLDKVCLIVRDISLSGVTIVQLELGR